jgi:DNA mismatch endonuclease, patch repair protein
MARVAQKNSRPEIRVRKIAHSLGLRFRIHRKDLVGTPDIVLPKHNLVVFVNGCFWHRHPGCRRASLPKTNAEKWQRKFEENVKRDQLVQVALKDQGWKVLVIWECETRDAKTVEQKLKLAVEQRS